MDELEKSLSGQNYDAHAPVFLEMKRHTRELLSQYKQLAYDQKDEKKTLLRAMFAAVGQNVSVGSPFICDYGRNISIGNNVSINMNCTFVDCNRIVIGNNVLIASNVQIYTATHPVELRDRLRADWQPDSGQYFCQTYAKPVTIGDGCWIGGGVIIIPGVTIGAGSVVVKDIPANTVAVGNPCRVIRQINQEERHA
ncbi:sugar O-acetyltransferase [Lactiplantibacillus pentosus]|uniref:sugar O-acetyltransferase n=1 Tax=Lactiplantibacillus pentosus TaxID=1589 RepID=UPI003C1BD205